MIIKYNKEEANLSGIYIIKCIKNDKFYIGSAVIFRKRKDKHLLELRNGIHHSPYLQRVYNKYGTDSLVFEILEVCSIENLIEREQFYINELSPHFNTCKIAGRGNRLGLKMSDKTKKLLSKSKKGKPLSLLNKQRISESKKGKKLSQEHKNNISKGRLGKTHSSTSKEKMSLNNWQKLDNSIVENIIALYNSGVRKSVIIKTLNVSRASVDKYTKVINQ